MTLYDDLELDKEIRFDEGKRNVVYDDGYGNLTSGVGHLCLPCEQRYLGQVISDEQVESDYAHDKLHAIIVARQCVPGFDAMPIVAKKSRNRRKSPAVPISMRLTTIPMPRAIMAAVNIECRTFPVFKLRSWDRRSVWSGLIRPINILIRS